MATRLLGFGILPIVGLVGPLVLIPILTRTLGPVGWGAVATGQALGAVGSTFIQYGWLTVGPPKVASIPDESARGVYFTSIVMRLMLLLVATPALTALTILLVPPIWSLLAVSLAISVAFGGLSSGWYFVGRGSPRGLLILEIGPRLLGSMIGAAVLLLGATPLVYGLIVLGTEILILTSTVRSIGRRNKAFKLHLLDALLELRSQFFLCVSTVVSMGYQRAAVAIVAGANSLAVPLYATADRAQSYSRLPLGPVVQSLQHWVYSGRTSRYEFWKRAKLASLVVVGSGFLAALLLLVALPGASRLFFGPALELSLAVALPLGVSVVAVSVSLALTTFVLVPEGEVSVVVRSVTCASLLAIPSVWIAARESGAIGSLWAVAGTEILVAIVQTVWGLRVTKTIRRTKREVR